MFIDYILSLIRKQKELMEILQRKLSSDSPPGLVRHHTSHHTLSNVCCRSHWRSVT